MEPVLQTRPILHSVVFANRERVLQGGPIRQSIVFAITRSEPALQGVDTAVGRICRCPQGLCVAGWTDSSVGSILHFSQ